MKPREVVDQARRYVREGMSPQEAHLKAMREHQRASDAREQAAREREREEWKGWT